MGFSPSRLIEDDAEKDLESADALLAGLYSRRRSLSEPEPPELPMGGIGLRISDKGLLLRLEGRTLSFCSDLPDELAGKLTDNTDGDELAGLRLRLGRRRS